MHPKRSGSAISRSAKPSVSPPRLGSRPSARPGTHGGFAAWRGPVFWPNAYRDIHGYALWPRAYGPTFWGFAFDDVFAGIFWPPGIAASETVGRASNRGGDRNGEATALSPEFARICSDKTPELTGRSFERFAQTIQPTDAQQAALDELRSASAKAIEMLRAACPTETPPTATERLDAMANRLAAMLDAVGMVRPALNRFYNSLTNEQKAQFNRISARVDSSQRVKALARSLRPGERSAPSHRCGNEWAPGFRDRTIQRMERVVRPTNAQRAALDELRTASAKAAKMLEVRCSSDPPSTPTGRLDAVGQRLAAMLRAVKTMAPAMAKFHALLSDEQRTRLNTMRDLMP
jgi:LTXXQ motif family protein